MIAFERPFLLVSLFCLGYTTLRESSAGARLRKQTSGLRRTAISKDSSPLLGDKPTPVILMSLGRSGSSAVFETMTALAGKSMRGYEIVGSSPLTTSRFFKEHTDTQWLDEYFQGLQKNNTDAGIVGFKWKPHVKSMALPGAKNALDRAKELGIKIVYSRRNPLDMVISHYKHSEAHLHAHCKVGDSECIAKHKQQKVILPTTKKVIGRLKEADDAHDQAQKLLRASGISYVNVAYEDLFFGDNTAQTWMKIFQHVGVGPAQGLTAEHIQESMTTAYTSSPRHADLLENYDEVFNFLNRTQYASLLH